MSHKKAYEGYVEKLVKCLPMDDVLFIAKLCRDKLLPGDTKNKLTSLSTEADKAWYFLNHVIKPALEIGNTNGFTKLLTVMKECPYDHVQTLSCEINNEIDKKGRKSSIHRSIVVLLFILRLQCFKPGTLQPKAGVRLVS